MSEKKKSNAGKPLNNLPQEKLEEISNKMKKNGRPPKEVDYKKLDQLLYIQCTGVECASVLDIHYDNLQRKVKEDTGLTFTEYSAIKKQGGKASLRRRQWKMSEKNPALSIWLGKQYLNQKDKQEVTGKDGEVVGIRVEIVNGKNT